jgi:hypothetical protein
MNYIKRKHKINKKILVLIIFIVIVGIYVFSSSLLAFNNIKFQNDPGYQGSYKNWNNLNTINILVLYNNNVYGNNLNTYNAILSIDPKGTVSVLNIPSNLNILTAPNSYQTLNTVYAVGNLNSPQTGVNLALKYLRYNLAIPIEGYISFNSHSIDVLKGGISIDSLYSFKYGKVVVNTGYNTLSLSSIKTILGITKDTQTSLYLKNTIFDSIMSKYLNPLSIIDFSKTSSGLKSIFYSNINKGSLNNVLYNMYKVGINNFKSYYVPINESNTNINLKNVDYYIRNNFLDYSFSNSSVLVQILDASNSNTAVYQFSRYIDNLGGNISSVGIYNGNQKKDLIYVSNIKKYAYDVSVIKKILGDNNVKIIDRTPSFFYTGSIIVVLGTDDTYIY